MKILIIILSLIAGNSFARSTFATVVTQKGWAKVEAIHKIRTA